MCWSKELSSEWDKVIFKKHVILLTVMNVMTLLKWRVPNCHRDSSDSDQASRCGAQTPTSLRSSSPSWWLSLALSTPSPSSMLHWNCAKCKIFKLYNHLINFNLELQTLLSLRTVRAKGSSLTIQFSRQVLNFWNPLIGPWLSHDLHLTLITKALIGLNYRIS